MKLRRALQIGCMSVLLYPFRLLLVAILMTIALGLLGGSITAALFDFSAAKGKTLFAQEARYLITTDQSTDALREFLQPYLASPVAFGVGANVVQSLGLYFGSKSAPNSDDESFRAPDHLVYAPREYYEAQGIRIVGRLPAQENEIAVSVCTYRAFHSHGYQDATEDPGGGNYVERDVPSMEAFTDGSFRLRVTSPDGTSIPMSIVGVIDYGECHDHAQEGSLEASEREALYVCEAAFEKYAASRQARYAIVSKGASYANDAPLLSAVEASESFGFSSFLAQQIDAAAQTLDRIKQIMLYVGIGLSAVSAALIWQFASLTLESKKQEIGILRAMGCGRAEIHFIFHSGILLFSLLYAVLGSILCIILVPIVNQSISSTINLPLAFLSLSPWSFLAIFAISLTVAFLSAFIPIFRIVRRPPIEIIKTFET